MKKAKAAGKPYDAAAKRILSNMEIIVEILRKTQDEFRSLEPDEIASLVDGVDAGTREVYGRSFLYGGSVEDSDEKEGKVTYDVLFRTKGPKGVETGYVVNLEAQRNLSPGYPLLNRAIYYVSRMISSQRNRDFRGSNYGSMRRVRSIWILQDAGENSISSYSFSRSSSSGSFVLPGDPGLIGIDVIALGRELDEEKTLLRLLGALLSDRMMKDEKMSVAAEVLGSERAAALEGEIEEMCNLSEGVYQRGMDEGLEKGLAEGMDKGRAEGRTEGIGIGESNAFSSVILNMRRKGRSASEIADLIGRDEAFVLKVIADSKGNSEK